MWLPLKLQPFTCTVKKSDSHSRNCRTYSIPWDPQTELPSISTDAIHTAFQLLCISSINIYSASQKLIVTLTPRTDWYVPGDWISARILIFESIKSLQPLFFNLFIKYYNLWSHISHRETSQIHNAHGYKPSAWQLAWFVAWVIKSWQTNEVSSKVRTHDMVRADHSLG